MAVRPHVRVPGNMDAEHRRVLRDIDLRIPFDNFFLVADPTANDDVTKGYEIGSRVISAGGIFQCLNPAEGNADWAMIFDASGGAASGPFTPLQLIRANASGLILESSGKLAPAGDIVGTSDTQTLTSKTLTTPTIASFANANHDHADSAGGGALATRYAREGALFYLENPSAGQAFPLRMQPVAGTMISVRHITDSGTATFNIEKRAPATPFTAGTDIWSSDKTADTSSTEETSFDSGSISEDQTLWCAVSGVTSSPGTLFLTVKVDVA